MTHRSTVRGDRTRAGRCSSAAASAGRVASAQSPACNPARRHRLDLCDTLGWLDGHSFRPAPAASIEQLAPFHDPDYVEALRAADAADP